MCYYYKQEHINTIEIYASLMKVLKVVNEGVIATVEKFMSSKVNEHAHAIYGASNRVLLSITPSKIAAMMSIDHRNQHPNGQIIR